MLGTINKRPNRTRTETHVVQSSFYPGVTGSNRSTDLLWLGNNGRLTIILPTAPVTPPPPEVPKTGDESNIAVYIIFLMLALSTIIGMTAHRIRRIRKSKL
jgi:LPXTG-motif cell wall-anchored protein